jgi:glycosyltransferase involved in cell wall biosynthesis
MKSEVLIIIPAYNEEESIFQTVTSIQQLTDFNYIVINDGSTDRTAEILDYHHFDHIDLPVNLGIGGAMQTGYIYAGRHDYQYAVQFDADGQHSADDLRMLVQQMKTSDYDMIIGSRFVEKSNYKGSLSRRLGIYYFDFILQALTKTKISDPTSGYRIVNQKIIKEFMKYYPTDYPEVEVIAYLSRRNYKIREFKVEMNQRQGGTSSITPIKSIYYMLKVTFFTFIRSVF